MFSNKALTFELQQEKTYLLTCAPIEDSTQLAHLRNPIKIFVSAWIIVETLVTLKAPGEDFDQTAGMSRMVWILVGRTCPKVRFLTLRLIFLISPPKLILLHHEKRDYIMLTPLNPTFWGGRVVRRCRVSYVTGASNWYWLTVGQGLLSL